MMSSSVQTLIKATQSSAAQKSGGRSSFLEADGEAFQAALGRASKRGKSKSAEPVEEAKPAKAGRSRKAESKDEPGDAERSGKAESKDEPGDAENEEAPVEAVEEASATKPADSAVVKDEVVVSEAAAVITPEILEAKDEEAPTPIPLAMAVAAPVSVSVETVEADTTDQPIAATVKSPVTAATPIQSQPAGAVEAADPAQAAARQTVAVAEESIPAPEQAQTPSEALKPDARATTEPRATKEDSWAQDSESRTELPSKLSPPENKPEIAKPAPESPSSPSWVDPAKAQATLPGVLKTEVVQKTPEVRFAETNHADIVQSIRTELLPSGGTMRIRLDPPELGALQVILSIKDGIATASFQTSNDEATRLLSHSLSQLKTAIESTGVAVDKLQVQQAPRDEKGGAKDESHQRGQPGQEDMTRQQEQQRKEMLRRLWRRLNVGSDPLDLVA